MSEKKGLGKGLSALIAEAKGAISDSRNDNVATSRGPQQVAVDSLKPGTFQPRRFFADEELQDLAQSIRKNGVMQPIIVRPKGAQYEIIAGERRWRACKIAGFATIPAIVKELDDNEALEIALVENIQRQDLSVLEEAEGYARLMKQFDYTQQQIASTVGKSRSHIANLLRLLSLPPEIRKYIEQGELSAGHAKILVGIENPVSIANEIIDKKLNVRQAERVAQRAKPSEKKDIAKKEKKGNLDATVLGNNLSDALNLKIKVMPKGEKGTVTIAYNNAEELDKFVEFVFDNSL